MNTEPSQAEIQSRLANAHLARLMGMVLSLRFFSWGGVTALLCGVLFLEANRYPAILGWLGLPALLAVYLAGTGQVLFLIRSVDGLTRAFSLGPLLTVALLSVAPLRTSPTVVALLLALGLWLYLAGFARQAMRLGHARAFRWFSRWHTAVLVGAVLCLVPGWAAPLATVGGVLTLCALLAGWRIWLQELRLSIEERELQ